MASQNNGTLDYIADRYRNFESQARLFFDTQRSDTLVSLRGEHGANLVIREKDEKPVPDRIIEAKALMANISPVINRIITLLRLSSKFTTYIAVKKGVNASVSATVQKQGSSVTYSFSYSDFLHLHEYLLAKKVKSLPKAFAYSKKRLVETETDENGKEVKKKSIPPGSYPVVLSRDLGQTIGALIGELRTKYAASNYTAAALSLVTDESGEVRGTLTRDALAVFITMLAGHNTEGGNKIVLPTSSAFYALLTRASPFESNLKPFTGAQLKIFGFVNRDEFLKSAATSKKSGKPSYGVKDDRERLVNYKRTTLVSALRARQARNEEKGSPIFVFSETRDEFTVASSMVLAIISAHTFGKSDLKFARVQGLPEAFASGIDQIESLVESYKRLAIGKPEEGDQVSIPFVSIANAVTNARTIYKNVFASEVAKRKERKAIQARLAKNKNQNNSMVI